MSEALQTAARSGDIGAMAAIVASGVSVDAIHSNHSALVWAANDGKIDAVRWLLDHGAAVDIRTAGGEWTPLMVAAVMGHPDIVDLLLERGGDPAAKNHMGRTLVEILVERGKPDMAKYIASRIMPDPREVIYHHPVADLTMQEIYNFTLKERITILRKGREGEAQAIQREHFSTLADKSALRRAFAEHQRRGGKMTEADITIDALPKGKLAAPKVLKNG